MPSTPEPRSMAAYDRRSDAFDSSPEQHDDLSAVVAASEGMDSHGDLATPLDHAVAFGGDPVEVAALSIAYSEAVREAQAAHEGSLVAQQPLGKRVAVVIPQAQWEKLATAVCAITGGDVA